MTYQLNLQELACQRGEQPLFSGLSWEFGVGSLTQIEGHNGIGKTSLLRIMAGLAQPVAGQVNWNGRDIRRQREEYAANLLYLGHHSGIKPELTPWENLRFYQQVSAARQGDEVLWDVLEKVGRAIVCRTTKAHCVSAPLVIASTIMDFRRALYCD